MLREDTDDTRGIGEEKKFEKTFPEGGKALTRARSGTDADLGHLSAAQLTDAEWRKMESQKKEPREKEVPTRKFFQKRLLNVYGGSPGRR